MKHYLLLLFYCYLFLHITFCQQNFQGATVYIGNLTVSATTYIGISCQLSSPQYLVTGDYAIITLPSQTASQGGATFQIGKATSCTVIQGAGSVNCTILNTTNAMIIFNGVQGSQVQSFEARVGNFTNPDSVRNVNGIAINLFSGTGSQTLKSTSLPQSLTSFTPTTISGTLASTSNVVGALNVALKFTVQPSSVLKAQGTVVLTVPQYYLNAGASQMIASSSPSCSGISTNSSYTVTIQGGICSFNTNSLQLVVPYSLTSSGGSDLYQPMTITVQSFKNPISTASQNGFSLTTYDSLGNTIGTVSGLSLSGVTVPGSFASTSVSLLNDKEVQEYGTVQLQMAFNIPIQQTCFIKITFPIEFGVDSYLTSITGNGIFQTAGGYFIYEQIDYAGRAVYLRGCDQQYGGGSSNLGALIFTKVQNPNSVRTTSSFSIIIAQDTNFVNQIVSLNSGLLLQSGSLTSGLVGSISVSYVDSSTVQAETGYMFTFTPTHGLLTQSNSSIVITLPTSVSTQPVTPCVIIFPSTSNGAQLSFDPSIVSCTFLNLKQILISNPFSVAYTGGQPLSIIVSRIVNPISAQAPGTFNISTYMNYQGNRYPVDTGLSILSMSQATIGLITKQSITVNQSITFLQDQIYIFSLVFQQSVPIGGYLIIILPLSGEITIAYPQDVSSYCYQPNLNVSISCTSINNNTAIRVNIDSKGFPLGIANSTGRQISIKGFKNPRTTYPTSSFNVTSYDQNGYTIGQTSKMDLTVAMSQSTNISYISVSQSNSTNGALATYTFVFISLAPIYQNDTLTMTFPSQFTFKGTTISCSLLQPSLQLPSSIDCSYQSLYNLILKFTRIVNHIQENTQVIFTVSTIQNAPSLQTSSLFTNIAIQSFINGAYYEVSRYRANNLAVSNSIPAILSQFSISQSNQNAQSQAMYTITFYPINPIPTNGSMIVTLPPTMQTVINGAQCSVTLTQLVQSVCKITSQSISIQNAFKTIQQPYSGQVTINFQAINPQTNINQVSISLQTYSDSNFLYIMDQTSNGLVPTLNCNYPCYQCSTFNPDYCVACFQGDLLPGLLQVNSTNSSQQTCVTQCYSGYTQNGSTNPPKCNACSKQCATCNQNDQAGDINRCTTCSPIYPFSYAQNQTCFSNCPDSTYTCNKYQCCNCVSPCKTCSGANTCLSCFTNSSLPLLWGNKCVSACPLGFTKIGFNCVPCTSPCSTCDQGNPTSCLTCDATQGRQFLFGRNCVSECPTGTIAQVANQSFCQGCQQGCDVCDLTDNAICLKCSPGRALFNQTCYSECPFNYVKSTDGTACQLSLYLLDNSLVYFPFSCVAIAFLSISLSSFAGTRGKSLIISNSIAFLSLVEVSALAFQTYESYVSKRPYLIITLASFIALLINIVLNLTFTLYYCFRLQFSDRKYDHWRQKNVKTVGLVLAVSLLVSFKMFRLVYSRLFGIDRFSAQIENKLAFTKRVQLFGIISIVLFSLPLITVDAFILYYLPWGSQLYITCAESGGLALIIAVLTVFDNCCSCSRLREEEEEEKLVYQGLDEENDNPKLLRFQRERLLRGLLSTVQFNRENHLLDFETIEDDDEGESYFDFFSRRRCYSLDANVPRREDSSVQGEDERSVASYHFGESLRRSKRQRRIRIVRKRGTKNVEEVNNKHGVILQDPAEDFENFKFNNVYAEAQVKGESQEIQGIEIEIQTDEIDQYGLLRRQKTRVNRQLDDIVHEGESTESLEQEIQDSVNQELKHIKERVKGKKRGQTTKNSYFAQIDQDHTLNVSDNISGLDDLSQRRLLWNENDLIKETLEGKSSSPISSLTKSINSKQRSRSKISSSDKTATVMDDRPQELQTLGQSSQSKEKTKRERDSDSIISSFKLKSTKLQGKNSKRLRKGSLVSKSSRSSKKYKSEKSKKSSDSKSQKSLENDQDALLSAFKLREMVPEKELFNERTFSILDIMGDFNDDVIKEGDVREFDSMNRAVNQHGYLIDYNTGDIINKYNYNVMFEKKELTPEGDIPMPYKLESYNFNPHEVMGHFDYDERTLKPVILKSRKSGRLVDKHLRPVNRFGLLEDDQGNILNNDGKVRLLKDQLKPNGDLPLLINYEGKAFDVRTIIGIFDRNPFTKEIVFSQNPFHLTDKFGRNVNKAGYFVDKEGNIAYKGGSKIVFHQSQLLFNEPPKIYEFTTFEMADIKGDQDAYQREINSDLILTISDEGIEGEDTYKTNCCGHRVDRKGNIVDQSGNVVFRKEILEVVKDKRGREVMAQVPLVFRQKADKRGQLKGNLVMIDAEDFLKGRLEQIQDRNAFGGHYDDGQPQQADDVLVQEFNDEGGQHYSSEDESSVNKEIFMFRGSQIDSPPVIPLRDAQIPDDHISLFNQRPNDLHDMNQSPLIETHKSKRLNKPPKHLKNGLIAYKASIKDPLEISSYLSYKGQNNRSHSNLNFNDKRKQMSKRFLNKTGSAILTDAQGTPQNDLQLGHLVLKNQFMANSNSHQSRESLHSNLDKGNVETMKGVRNEVRASGGAATGMQIIQNDFYDKGPLYNDDSEYDDNDTVFEQQQDHFDVGEQQLFLLKARQQMNSTTRSKSQQRLSKQFKMYDVPASMSQLHHWQKHSQAREAADNAAQEVNRKLNQKLQHGRREGQSKLQDLQNIYSDTMKGLPPFNSRAISTGREKFRQIDFNQ